MTFNSLTFLAFFAVVVLLHNLPFSWRTKKRNLLAASYLFYAAWNPPFVVLLWLSTALDWQCARWLDATDDRHRRRAILLLSLAGNLGLLAYFKYGGFVLDNVAALAASVGVAWKPPAWDIVLPVGISFYTFQTLSYTLDVFLRRARPATSFLDFALFVTFFPQLVAGPIVRPTDLMPQFAAPRAATRAQVGWGLMLMTLGLFQKIVLADGFLAPVADAVYGSAALVAPLDAWLGTLAFSGQIFCDFAGYTTTAIGASEVLGFSLIDNFRYPYAAIGFSDFWRRWHISLSTWLRDYLYVPLGGNRKRPARRLPRRRAPAAPGRRPPRALGPVAGAPRAGAADLGPRQRHLGLLPRPRLPHGEPRAARHARHRRRRGPRPRHVARAECRRARRRHPAGALVHARARAACRGGAPP
ncbi:MAG: hypothetical protein MUC69_05820, partial [Gemmatimonadales bacterium]|nr:hypothetical protein [Gemmatimonadales bacterium]